MHSCVRVPIYFGVLAVSRMMRSLGFQYQTSPVATLPVLGQSSGLAVYSKLPILRETHAVFSQRRAVTRKGWLEVELDLSAAPAPVDAAGAPRSDEVAGDRLVILATHMEHSHHPSWRAVRERQWKQLVARATQLVADETNGLTWQASGDAGPMVAVLGDFNVCSRDLGQLVDGGAEHRALADAMQSAGLAHELLCPAAVGTEPQEMTARPTLRLPSVEGAVSSSPDHFFVTSPLWQRLVRAAVVDTRGRGGLCVSDHFGLFAEFRI
ncbi:unnamed protein product [Polarella glacialis]|uniref:Endonuclease/exonuclease/phosphatase domain-containing protein n=1 Tax=Polarella glacialis TaxID=89957 RepID=A0A813IGA9_POLGL|nr:unnamed protein product [Polarella glacialis]